MGSVLVAIQDLLFLSKVRGTAQQLGVAVESARRGIPLGDEVTRVNAARVLVELSSAQWGPAAVAQARAQAPAVEIIGYCRHTSVELIEQGKTAGCSRVLTQGEFSRELPELLKVSP